MRYGDPTNEQILAEINSGYVVSNVHMFTSISSLCLAVHPPQL